MPTWPLIWSPDSLGIFLRDQQAYNQLDSSANGIAGRARMWREFHGVPATMSIGLVRLPKLRLGLPRMAF